jgi:hypothetical protein
LLVINTSTLDFVDLHPYADNSLSIQQYAENFRLNQWNHSKPLLMGEFGAQTKSYISVESAAKALEHWQVQSCPEGFSGWLLWTWDLDNASNPYWAALSGNDIIGRVLSPNMRPNPCVTASYPGENLAFGAAVSASSYRIGFSPELAVDGKSSTFWSSGSFPPQWIQVEFPRPQSIEAVRLTVDQFPNGATTHRLLAIRQLGSSQLLREFNAPTSDLEVLTWMSTAPVPDVVAIRIETTSGPSWVGWRDVEVISAAKARPRAQVTSQ